MAADLGALPATGPTEAAAERSATIVTITGMPMDGRLGLMPMIGIMQQQLRGACQKRSRVAKSLGPYTRGRRSQGPAECL